MKVSILGAGPAGLYLAILLKRADPAHEITVVERNAPDATFGWGVVFSEETMGELRDADYRTYLQITDTFARWDAIHIRYRDHLLRSRGHGFSAIGRRRLLAILQERCRELGVELCFGQEVLDVKALRAGADLLVGADGVNSLVRRNWADAFGARVKPEGGRFAWFGTDLVLDAFTFAFRETEHGVFEVHGYPFDERTSTFIVECPEDTWRSAGLDAMDEDESIAFCRELFAPELQGHRLLSNRSIWMRFQKVRCRSWHHENVVILGDAAHTAHFTIGSGTKLAMEDSISLAKGFLRHEAIGPALVDFELERQPVVERFQQAASDSAAYFERVRRYHHMEPLQFGFNLLTRSGRITHTNLAQRDPEYVRRMDAWFAGRDALAPPPLFVEARIGPAVLANRIVAHEGTPAAATAGLVLSEPVAVSPEGRITSATPLEPGVVRPVAEHLPARGTDGVVVACLTHAGRRGATRTPEHGVDVPLPAEDSWELLAPSAIPFAPYGRRPRAMDEEDLRRVRDDFADAARAAADAGYGALEIDCAHGRLLASFLSPLSNRRDDAYGTDRLRFPLEVLGAVRAAWPADRLLIVRLTVADWRRGGLTIEDGIRAAAAFAEHGCDLIHVEAGQTVAEERPEYRRGFLTAFSDRVRNEARVATLVGGHLTTPDAANTVLAAGRADLCLLDLAAEDTVVQAPEPAAVGAAA